MAVAPSPPLALLVSVATNDYLRRLGEAAAAGLRRRHEVVLLDLIEQGFSAEMSAEERRAYHGNHPILDPLVEAHAGLVGRASTLAFVFPVSLWTPPAVLKGWLERVLAPGVAFVFDSHHRVRPHLHNVSAIGGAVTYSQTAAEIRAGGDGARTTVLRTLRLNVPRRVRTRWHGSYPGMDGEAFLAKVEAGLGRL